MMDFRTGKEEQEEERSHFYSTSRYNTSYFIKRSNKPMMD